MPMNYGPATRSNRSGLVVASDGATYDHKPEPVPGTVRSARIGADQDARPLEYPHEAACLHCARVIRLGQEMPIGPIGTWQHTGTKATQET